jgi:hypothetical protein
MTFVRVWMIPGGKGEDGATRTNVDPPEWAALVHIGVDRDCVVHGQDWKEPQEKWPVATSAPSPPIRKVKYGRLALCALAILNRTRMRHG